MKTKVLYSLAIFWSLFIGIGALAGSMMMFIDPSGKLWKMEGMLPAFQVLPYPEKNFQNFIFPGIALLCVNGIPNMISFYLLKMNHRYGALSGIICGVILMLWISIQFVIFEFNVMSTLYFVFGILQMTTGILYFRKQKNTIVP